MKLIQDRLDARDKTRSNLFNWRGQFTPDFVDYILQSFTHSGDTVVDPFSGSGTVLLECARRDLSCYGFEINPAAYAMSKFFTFSNVPHKIRLEIVSSLEEKMLNLLPKFHGLPSFSQSKSFRTSYKNLLEFSLVLFSELGSAQERIIALNTLFVAENCRGYDLHSSIVKSLNYIKNSLINLPFTERVINARLGDARLVHRHCLAKADVIFTSPPYINVFNYHQNYRAILETLGWNTLKVAQSEIGSNRKNRGNRFKTVVQYCLDMEQALKSFWECIDDGLIILVVGRESNVRKIPFHSSKIVKEIAEQSDSFRDIEGFERAFINKFGVNIKEDIITMRKGNVPPFSSGAREIALNHLRHALNIAPRELKQALLDVIDCLDTIEPSPLFTTKGVFLNV